MFRRKKRLVVDNPYAKQYKIFCLDAEGHLFMIDSARMIRAEFNEDLMRNRYLFEGDGVVIRQVNDLYDLKREVGL